MIECKSCNCYLVKDNLFSEYKTFDCLDSAMSYIALNMIKFCKYKAKLYLNNKFLDYFIAKGTKMSYKKRRLQTFLMLNYNNLD